MGRTAQAPGETPGNEFVNLQKALNHAFQPVTYRYSEREASLYALAVGAAGDPLNRQELRFVYELARGGFQVLPTFAVVFPTGALEQIAAVPGLKFNLMNLLHGEQVLELHGPLPPQGYITSQGRISQIYDKGSGALVLIDIHSYDAQDRLLAYNQASVFIRGLGGFGGERGPSGQYNLPPDRLPDAIYETSTQANQALLYRLASGDRNPLHADPDFASMVGFSRPILHGLCTFGIAGLAALREFAGSDPQRFRGIRARFSRHVYPGETILTEMWQESETRILFQSKVRERDERILTHGAVELVPPHREP